MEKKVFMWEPWFFMAFGLFHLHRIWGLIDRSAYAGFCVNGHIGFALRSGNCHFCKKQAQKLLVEMDISVWRRVSDV